MNILNDLNNAKIVESTDASRDEVMKAVEIIFSDSIREPLIHLVLDDTNNKAFLCLYKEPLLAISGEVISLERDENKSWVPVVDKNTLLYRQLSKLSHDSQDSQQH